MEQVEKMISKREIARSILMTLRPASWELILCSVQEPISESGLLRKSLVIPCREKKVVMGNNIVCSFASDHRLLFSMEMHWFFGG